MTNEAFLDRTEYPAGVPCLIDTEQPDPEAAAEFYGGLFGWEFENKLPPGSGKYLVASRHGYDVAAIATPTPGVTGPPTWNTYVSVVDADATTAQAVALGAEVVVAPVDVGPPGSTAGRWAALTDPDGAPIRLWQPGYRHGAQMVNAPGSWNSSDLVTTDVERREGVLRRDLRLGGGSGRLRRRRRGRRQLHVAPPRLRRLPGDPGSGHQAPSRRAVGSRGLQ